MEKNLLKDAVETVIESLKNDPEYYRAWKDNIAMAFKDEFERHSKEADKQIDLDIHNIANTAADNFLNILMK